MAFQMIDRDQRLSRRERKPLACKQPDHHSADQSRPGSRGDGIELAGRDPGFGKHSGNQPGKNLDMRPGGDLRDHSAERLVRGVLPDHCLRKDPAIGRHQRGGAVVAGAFKAKD